MSITSITSQAADLRLQNPTAQQTAPRTTPPAASATEAASIAAAAAPSAAAGAVQYPAPQPTALEQVQQAMEDVRKAITPVAQDLLFSIDEDTGKTVVKVVDASTDEVIRQIPSEEIISIAKALDKLQGLLVQQKA